MNILIDSNIVLLKDSLLDDFNIITYDGGELTQKLIVDNKAEILFVRSTTICNKDLLEYTNVKFIGTATAGIDNLDLDYLKEKNILWTNASGSNSISVAEFVTLAIQYWCLENKQNIEQQTLGIVGYGNIGTKVAKIFENYCPKILVYDPYVTKVQTSKTLKTEFDYLLENSTIITFHTPLTMDADYPTFQMLDYEKLKSMKDTKLLINAARGGVIDELSLVKLNYNPLNLIFDVWESEPNINSKFAQNLFLSTPHIAGHSYEGKLRGTLNMLQSLENYLGVPVNKDMIINELNKNKKIKLSNLRFSELFKILESNINLKNTNFEFKNILSNYNSKYFNKMRKEYPKHNESLSEDSFE